MTKNTSVKATLKNTLLKVPLLYNKSNMLQLFTNDLKNIVRKVDKNIKIDHMIYTDNENTSIENFKSRFCADELLYKMKSYKIVKKCVYKFNGNKIYLNVLLKDVDSYSIKDLYIKALKCLCVLEYLGVKNSNILIWYCPLDDKKYVFEVNQFIPYNINSGFTTHIKEQDKFIPHKIAVFRNEESDKVFLHELIHYLEKDFAGNYDIELDKTIIDTSSFKKHINLFESYTDYWAILFNSVINSIITKENIHNYIYTETQYHYSRLKHILYLNGLNNIDELFNPSVEINQDTSMFAYYILKSGIMPQIDEFISKWNIKSIKWNRELQWEFYIFILNGLKKVPLIDIITPYKFKIDGSLRMTYNDIVLI